MAHFLDDPSDVSELMPCPLDWSMSKKESFWNPNTWTFWSRRPNDELNYQRKKMAAPVVPTYTGIGKDTTRSIFERISDYYIWLVQFWSPVKVNGLTFLSTADQPFALTNRLDKRLCAYRRHCVDTLIPVDIDYANSEALLGPPGRAYISGFPEYTRDIQSYSAVEFPLFQHATQAGIRHYCAIPVFKLHENHCLGVFEFASKHFWVHLTFPNLLKESGLGSCGLYIPCRPEKILLFERPVQVDTPTLVPHQIEEAVIVNVDVVHDDHIKLEKLFGDMIHPDSHFEQPNVEFDITGNARSNDKVAHNNIARYGRKSVEAEAINREIHFVSGAATIVQKNDLQKNDIIQRIVKDNGITHELLEQCFGMARDEHNSFEVGRPLPSVQSLQGGGGETTKINSFLQQSNLQNVENNVATAPVVPSCSSHRLDSFNQERPVQVDLLLQHPTEKAVANRRRVDTDVADDHIEIEKDMTEMMQPDCHFEQPNLEIDYTGNARSNDRVEHSDIAPPRPTNLKKIQSQEDAIQRIAEDHKITRKILEQHFGKKREDAAKDLQVSVSTLKRICRDHDISRWPHYKTRKVNHHASKGVAVQGVEPYVRDQERPDRSQEKGTDYLVHKPSPATGKACASVMTVKVTYKDDIIKFKLTASSTRVELQEEVEKRLNISLEKFSIKYQDEDDDWVTITGDSDLREGMSELRLLGKTTMKLLVTPKSET